MTETIIHQTAEVFETRYKHKPEAVSCGPGRVELLGNHTDYNEGYVLSVALDMQICMAGSADEGTGVEIYSQDFDACARFNTDDISKTGTWDDYVKGVIVELQKLGIKTGGFRAVIGSTVPRGTGLSSSAALEVAAAMLIKHLYPYDIDPFDLARLCRRAENDFVGMNCGILDQFSSVFGHENSALFLDCRSSEYDIIPIGKDDISIVVCNSMQKHELVSSEFNTRQEECFRAAAYFQKMHPDISMLRDVTPEMLAGDHNGLDSQALKRARHVVNENQRVIDGCRFLRQGALDAFGECINASHQSSRDLFENSTPELDLLQSAAMQHSGTIGAKLSGGGFGGCIVAVTAADAARDLMRHLQSQYERETGIVPDVFVAGIADGARIL